MVTKRINKINGHRVVYIIADSELCFDLSGFISAVGVACIHSRQYFEWRTKNDNTFHFLFFQKLSKLWFLYLVHIVTEIFNTFAEIFSIVCSMIFKEEALKDTIRQKCTEISQNKVRKAVSSWKKRLRTICDQSEGHIDHVFNWPPYVSGIVVVRYSIFGILFF